MALLDSSAWFWSGLLLFPLVYPYLRQRKDRRKKITPTNERVLILGASSGIGRSIAHLYAARGARLALVARREQALDAVLEECQGPFRNAHVGVDETPPRDGLLRIVADYGNADDMIRVRATIEQQWHGLDTLIVCAGVSALRPLLAVAGVERAGGVFTPEKPSADGLERVKEVAFAAIHGNYLGPMLAAVTFIPLLTTTSTSPAILQISSAAAVVPAPTRSLYGSTKAASLMLYRSLAIEHPEITFSYVLPATVEGDFRASAVDGGPIREDLTHGLKREVVAAACLRAVDRHIRHVFLPSAWSALPFLYALLPNFIERMASRKYKFNRS